jgi:hypothetical protein
MSTGVLKNYAGFATQNEFVSAIKTDFSASLDLIYRL